MRTFTAAAVQIAPVPGPLSPETVRKNLDKCVDFTRRCVDASGAELVVLPETATTGFTPDCTVEELWDLRRQHAHDELPSLARHAAYPNSQEAP